MPHTPDPSADATEEAQIQEAAAAWFARLHGKPVSGPQRQAFAGWLAENPAHAREYEILEEIWNEAARLQQRPRPAQKKLRLGVAVSVALLCGWLSLGWLDGRVSTDPGEIRHLKLSDGSQLDIAPDSRLRIRIDGEQRRIELLAGEIAIDVAGDHQRPFTVEAGGYTIHDIGTRFGVRSSPQHTRVTVAEGSVEIRPTTTAQAPLRVDAGQTVDIENGQIGPRQPVERRLALDWSRGQLAFDAVPLFQVVAELNRFRKQPIVVDDARLREIRISGVFLIADEQAAPRALEQLAPMQFIAGDGCLLARPNH